MLSQETIDVLHEIKQRLEEVAFSHRNGFFMDGVFRAIDEIDKYFGENLAEEG